MWSKVGKNGFTLIEVLIVLSIIGLLATVLLTTVLRKTGNSYDAVRKSDLKAIHVAFEDYYSDHESYPPATIFDDYCVAGVSDTELSGYLEPIPCDPQTGEAYLYIPFPDTNDRTKGFRVFAKLSQENDRDIAMLGCSGEDGCGVAGAPEYNYGVAEGLRVSLFDPEILGNEEDEDEDGGSEPTSTPTPIVPNLCDFDLAAVCYTCEGNCNVCDPNGPPNSRCPAVGSYASLASCIALTECIQ